jgi:Protein of unknown function (DUF3800)
MLRAEFAMRSMYCGLLRTKWGRRNLMALTAYVDDSGSGGDSRYYILGGYLSAVPEWESFTQEWCAELKAKPAIDYFKSVEAESMTGQFASFYRREIKGYKINQLLAVIQRHVFQCVTSTLLVSDYDAIARGRVLPEFDNPYYFCFMGTVPTFALYDQIFGGCEVIDFVFDRQLGLEAKAREIFYDQLKTIPKFAGQIGNIDYRDDKEFPPLQAADLAAWHARRYWCGAQESQPEREHFEVAKTLKRPPLRAYLEKHHIQNQVDFLAGRESKISTNRPMLRLDGKSMAGSPMEDRWREFGLL